MSEGRRLRFLGGLLAAAVLATGCGVRRPRGGDDDADADGDADVDGDADGDGCADRDGDGFLDEACGGDDCDDASAAAHPGGLEDSGWTVETIDAEAGSGYDPALAPGPDGALRVAYGLYGAGTAVRVAVRSAGTWVEQARWAARTPEVGFAVDAGGSAHVTFVVTNGNGDPEVDYASDVGGAGWNTARLEDHHWNSLSAPSVAVAPLAEGFSNVEVVYLLSGILGSQVRHAGLLSSFEPADLDGASGSANGTAAVMQDTGVLHVAYVKAPERGAATMDLRYRGSGAVEIVEAAVSASTPVALALAADGTPVVAYASGAFEVRVARASGPATWQIETVPGALTAAPLGLAVDATGAAHVAFVDAATSALTYATDAPGDWHVEPAGAAQADGTGIALAIDATGAVEVAFRDPTTQTLRLATLATPPDGADTDCDGVIR